MKGLKELNDPNFAYKIEAISTEEEKKQKKCAIVFFLIIMGLEGVLSAFDLSFSKVLAYIYEWLLVAAIIGITLSWMTIEKKREGLMLRSGWIMGIIFFVPGAFSYYAFQTRGFKLGTIFILKAVGLLFLGVLLAVAFEEITIYMIERTSK